MATYNERLAVALQFSPVEDALAGAIAYEPEYDYTMVRKAYREAITEIANYPIHGKDRAEYKEHDPLEEWTFTSGKGSSEKDDELRLRITNAIEVVVANFD